MSAKQNDAAPPESQETPRYRNRELSWLDFNERVLLEAADPAVPLLERLNFFGIFSNNMDEFFRIRVAMIKRLCNLHAEKHLDESEWDDNPEWILYGEGGKYLMATDAEQGKPQVIRITRIRPPRECSAQELVNELVRRAMSEQQFHTIDT